MIKTGIFSSGKARVHLRVHGKKIFAPLALRKLFADEIGQMLDMKPRHALFPVAVDAALITVAGHAAAAD